MVLVNCVDDKDVCMCVYVCTCVYHILYVHVCTYCVYVFHTLQDPVDEYVCMCAVYHRVR